MEPSTGTLCIHRVEADAQYVLRFEGADWSESFPSIEAAIAWAAPLVVEETKVVAYDVDGQGLVVTTLFPLTETVDRPPWANRVTDQDPESGAAAGLKTALSTKGIRGAVRYLNSLTSHRFTSLYHFDGPTLHSITFYDRQNPEAESCEDIPVEASYCVFVRDAGKSFVLPDASRDERVKGHSKRETVKRYCGVPLLDSGGKMFGSICHFDLEPGRIADREVELLERMAELLRPTL
jgi:GAF domain-containing protein